MEWLKRDTAAVVIVGPFLDSSDGVVPIENLAATMAVYLSRDGGAFALRTSAVAVQHLQDGYYSVPLNAVDVGAIGRLRLEVTDDDVHLSVWENYNIVGIATYSDTSGAGTLYVTEAEIRAKKIAGAVVDLTAYTDDELAAEINRASRMIDSITGDIFYTLEVAIDFNGTGMTKLFFPPKHPYVLQSATAVTEIDTNGVLLYTFTEGTDFVLYPYYLETVSRYDSDSPRLRFGSGGRWAMGQQNIRVDGSWGPTSTPAEISHAACLLTLESLIPGSTGLVGSDYKQVVWPDFTATFGGTDKYLGQSTGLPAVDRVLERFVNFSSLFIDIPGDRSLYEGFLNIGGR